MKRTSMDESTPTAVSCGELYIAGTAGSICERNNSPLCPAAEFRVTYQFHIHHFQGEGMKHSLSRFVWLAVLVALQLCLSTAPLVSSTSAERVTQPQVSRPAPIAIAVDATDAPRKILHARLAIPVKSGPLTLFYPKWIPGEHGPTGPITDLAGLKFAAAGKTVAWRRDDVDMYAFHLDVPPGANKLDVTLDFLLPASAEGFSSAASTTANLAVISWNQILLYPAGYCRIALSRSHAHRRRRARKDGRDARRVACAFV